MSRRRGRGRSGRSGRQAEEGTAGAVLKIALGLAVVGGLATVFFFTQQKVEATDGETFCNRAGPAEVHLVLLDASDPLDGVQAERTKAIIVNALKQTPENARVDIYVADSIDGELSQPVFSKCNPGPPTKFDGIVSDAKARRTAFEDDYLAAVEITMDRVLTAKELSSSPIIESLRSAATRSFARLDATVPVRLTIVSDMVQNSAILKQRGGDAAFSDFEASVNWPRAIVDLHDASIEIVYVSRPKYRSLQGMGHLSWWEKYFDAVKGGRVSVETI